MPFSVSRTYFKTSNSPKMSFWAKLRISHFQRVEILHFVQDDKNIGFEMTSRLSQNLPTAK
jgi:hypothetical protein